VDTKQTAMLRDLHARIAAGDFGESEVVSLLGLLREDSTKGSVLRELGDFISHRRRTEGRIHQYTRRLKEQAESFIKAGGGHPPQPELVFTEAQITTALNAGLRRHGLAALSQDRDPHLIPTYQARSRQVQLIMLATLQHIALWNGGKEFGRLELWLTPNAFQLMGCVVPGGTTGVYWGARALEVGNDFCPVPGPYLKPNGVWKIFVESGQTRIHGLW
jgi:hypothetical protein